MAKKIKHQWNRSNTRRRSTIQARQARRSVDGMILRFRLTFWPRTSMDQSLQPLHRSRPTRRSNLRITTPNTLLRLSILAWCNFRLHIRVITASRTTATITRVILRQGPMARCSAVMLFMVDITTASTQLTQVMTCMVRTNGWTLLQKSILIPMDGLLLDRIQESHPSLLLNRSWLLWKRRICTASLPSKEDSSIMLLITNRKDMRSRIAALAWYNSSKSKSRNLSKLLTLDLTSRLLRVRRFTRSNHNSSNRRTPWRNFRWRKSLGVSLMGTPMPPPTQSTPRLSSHPRTPTSPCLVHSCRRWTITPRSSTLTPSSIRIQSELLQSRTRLSNFSMTRMNVSKRQQSAHAYSEQLKKILSFKPFLASIWLNIDTIISFCLLLINKFLHNFLTKWINWNLNKKQHLI